MSMSMGARRAAIVALGTGLLGACAAESSEEGSGADAIVGGRDERDATYDAVVAIYDPYDHIVIGSGAFIAPGVVVTAEHLLAGVDSGSVVVRRGYDSSFPSNTYSVARIERVTAEGTESTVGFGADVAFLVLRHAANVTPLPMLDRPLDESDLGRSERLVAFGQTFSDVNTGSGRYRKSAPGVVTLVSGRPHAEALDPASPAPTKGAVLRAGYEAEVEPVGQGFACSGDSGGPHIADLDGVPTIIGLASAQTSSAGRCTAVYSIVSSFGPEVQASKARALAAAPSL